MQKKLIFNQSLISDGWALVEATNETILEGVYKKDIREGEERLMLAVLKVLLKISRSISWHGAPVAKGFFGRRRNGF